MEMPDFKQFMIPIDRVYSLSVINGFQQDQPEVGLIVNGRCVDVCRFDYINELFNIVYRVKAARFDDFLVYREELREIEDLTRRVYEMGGGAD